MKTRLASLLGITVRNDADVPSPTRGLRIPDRADDAPISTTEATRLAGVYRALSILSTSMKQLTLTVERGGLTLDEANTPGIIRRPNVNMSRADFVSYLTMSLAITGNSYIRKVTNTAGEVINLEPLNPWECYPAIDSKTGVKTVSYRGRAYSISEIAHLPLLTIPGETLGLGPIEAARRELSGVREVRDYSSQWFSRTGQPNGLLTTDQKATAEELTILRNAWNYLDADGNPLDRAANPSRVRTLSQGLKYQPLTISPRDAQWLEVKQFNTTEIARIFGIPAPLMLAAVEGNSQTYSNVEQEWIAFTRFTLAGYMTAIEDALTDLTPRGQRVKFNVESLLRTDTKARYEAHKLAIEMDLYDVETARRIEGITL